jgi:hypothetical protein
VNPLSLPAHGGSISRTEPSGKLHSRHPHFQKALVLEEVQVPVALGLGVVHRMLARHPAITEAAAGTKVHTDRQRARLRHQRRVSRTYHGELTPSAASKSCSDCIDERASVFMFTTAVEITAPTQISKEAKSKTYTVWCRYRLLTPYAANGRRTHLFSIRK